MKPFDQAQYIKEYVRPKRGLPTLPDDLVERYAIELPATDGEIAARIREVRAAWNIKSATTARICDLLIAEDQRLRAAHGDKVLTQSWWADRGRKQQEAAKANLAEMANQLRADHGHVGVVSRGVIDGFAAHFELSEGQALQAATQAGVTVVEPVVLPSPVITAAQFRELQTGLVESGARTIPELLHPGSGAFAVLTRYACEGDRSLQLNAFAVEAAIKDAERQAPSPINNARRNSLSILRTALKSGVDLGDLTIYHLAEHAKPAAKRGVGVALTAKVLTDLGLVNAEAAAIALTLGGIGGGASTGIDRVRELLANRQLNEAQEAAAAMPGEVSSRAEAERLVAEARTRLEALLADARAALAVPDEVRAESLLRQAAAISAADADVGLAAAPLAPADGLRARSEEAAVRLDWSPAPGHEGVTYVVTRTERAAALTVAEGTTVARQGEVSLSDPHAPVARDVFYSVFATAPGRPNSRPVSCLVMLLPPVANVSVDSGPNQVSVHWSTNPAVHRVAVVRSEDRQQSIELPVTGSTCHVTGLPEGQPVNLVLTAVYRGYDGKELRSAPVHQDATPRSEAKPVGRLRARTIDTSHGVRMRISWTPVDHSDVRIRRSTTRPTLTAQTWVTYEQMTAWGEEVLGRRADGRNEHAIEAEMPSGLHYLVPFSIGGTGIVVGEHAAGGMTDPVTGLVATPFTSEASLAWTWPVSAEMAEVTWDVDGDSDLQKVSRAEYTSKGVRVPIGKGPCSVEVRALITAEEAQFASPPARIVIDGRVAEVTYAVKSSMGIGRLGGRSKRVTFRTEDGCQHLRVRIVARGGPIMPIGPEGCTALLDTELNLPRCGSASHEVSVPPEIAKPYWVRCFVLSGPGRLVDPPTAQLKGS